MSEEDKPQTSSEVFPDMEGAQGSEPTSDAAAESGQSIEAMMGVPLKAEVIVGYAKLPLSDLLRMTRGSIIDLDRKVGDPVDIVVNGELIFLGELQRRDDDYLSVKLLQTVKKHKTEL